jgi:hypothetical protein
MRRLLRWRVILALTIVLVAVGVGGIWLFSRSDAAARMVSERLEARLGTTTRFERLSVGVSSTRLSELRVYEPGGSLAAEPVLAAGEVDVDVGAVGAAQGKDPTELHVRDARVLLRFDRQGDLLTRLPAAGGDGGAVPVIHIDSGVLTIRQEGRADTVFTGINLSIRSQGQAVQVTGTIEDHDWGRWTAEGSIPTAATGKTGTLTLQTVQAQAVTPDLLRRVPFVNPNAWTHVGLSGTTPARLELTYDAATEKVGYRIALEPTRTTVDVPSIGLHFTHAAGGLVAEGAVVTLTDVRGKAADGDVRLDSRMDFAGRTDVLRFLADLSNLDVRQLPKQWRMPPGLDGRLTGKVQFTVTLPAGGGTQVEAVGRATIAKASLKGRPIPNVELDVSSSAGGGIDFSERTAASGGRHEVRKPDESKLDELPAPKPADGRRPGLVSGILKLAARIVKPADAARDDRAYLHINLAFRDVDLTELLQTAGVEVPVKVGGKVSVQVQIDIPTETPDEVKAYRLTGTVRSRRATVDELAIEDVSARLSFRDGKLSVTDFVGRLPGLANADDDAGAFTARGELDVTGAYPFKATVKLDRVPLEGVELLRNLVPVTWRLSGEANVHASLEGTLSPLAVRSNGEAQVKRLRAGSIPADNLTFRWESDDEAIRFRDATAKVFGGEVSGSFDVPLRADAAGTGELKLANIELGELSKSLLEGGTLRMEGRAAGTIKLRSPAAGEGERGATADVDLQAPSMKLQGIAAKKIKGTATYRSGVFKYTLTGEALGGQFEVGGQYPPAGAKTLPKGPDKKGPPKKEAGLDLGRVRVRGIQLSRLWDLVGVRATLGTLDADLSGEFPLTTDDEGRLVGTGRLRADRLRFGTREIASAGQAIVRLTPTEMTFDEITLFAGEGVARGRVSIHRTDPERSTAALTLTNVPATRLAFIFPELASRLDIPVDGRITTSLGREIRGSGVLTASRGKLYGVPVTDVRLPITFLVVPDRGRSEVRLRDVTATAAGGQLTASLSVNTFNDLPPRVAGDLQFRNVNVASAFREAGRYIGNLPLSGRLDFGAEQYRGPNDLTATLRATLGESQPLALPVFAAMVPYLGYGRDSSTTIREGEVRAALGNGVWRVQRISLNGPSLALYADGTVTTAGRLNLTAVATSRSTPGQALLQRFNPLTVAVLASPTQPLNKALLADAVSLIGNYVIYLDVGGTIDAPAVRVDTLRTVSEDVARFFLLRFLNPVPFP